MRLKGLYVSPLGLASAIILFCAGYYFLNAGITKQKYIIKLGILHSLSGNLAKAEIPLVKAALLAIEEINKLELANGFVVEPVIADGGSDWPRFAREAERLIVQEKVCAIIGCYTSSSRKAVKPVVEKHNSLLMYATDYEGLERSPNIAYLGPVPNQHTLPGIMWCLNNLGKKFFLIGSDLIYPRVSHEIAKDHITSLGGTIVGEQFVKLDVSDFKNIIDSIEKLKPDVIISHLSGEINNIGFYRSLAHYKVTAEQFPVMSFTIAESDFLYIGVPYMTGHYITQCYMQSIHAKKNEEFVHAFQTKYPGERIIDGAMEAEYAAVYLWASAIKHSKRACPNIIKDAVLNESMDAPEGTIFVDPDNRNAWHPVRVGKVKKDGQINIIWHSGKPIQPIAYPIYRSRRAWDTLLIKFYEAWGKKWANL